MKNLMTLALATLFSVTLLAQNVGVGTDTPVPSAKLEVRSTDKGFLPPRMTAVQRDSIVGPVAGLILYCTNCGPNGEIQFYNGNFWRNMVGAAAMLPAAGQRLLGGVLGYVLHPGDPGYDPATPHGIIMASTDQSSGIAWYNGTYISVGSTQTIIGSGSQNTTAIVNAQGAGSYAAIICADLVSEGYSDWYLPSLDELQRMVAALPPLIPGDYWSSSEVAGPSMLQKAWYVYPNLGDYGEIDKSTILKVRAIRSF